MHLAKTHRGFGVITHEKYATNFIETRLVQESSAIGDYDDSVDKPGSSFLWLGQDHHLNREQVGELVDHLKHWLEHGRLTP